MDEHKDPSAETEPPIGDAEGGESRHTSSAADEPSHAEAMADEPLPSSGHPDEGGAAAEADAAPASARGEPGQAGSFEPSPEPSPNGEGTEAPDSLDSSQAPQADPPGAEEATSSGAPLRPSFKLPPRDDRRNAVRTRKGHAAPVLIPLERIEEDATFQLRPEGDLSSLATDLARLGQLFPVDVRLFGADRFQVVCGFRRVAALRFLKRDRVLARLHTGLSDEDALLMALADAIHAVPVSKEQLTAIRSRLEEEDRLGAEARNMLDTALFSEELAPESVEEEVDADELATDVTLRLGEINQDLSLLADVFSSLEAEQKRTLLEQLRYSAELVTYLEGK